MKQCYIRNIKNVCNFVLQHAGSVKEQYQVKMSNRFVVLVKRDVNEDISRAWGSIRKNIKISTKKSLSSKAAKAMV
jgi:hypothetical protein